MPPQYFLSVYNKDKILVEKLLSNELNLTASSHEKTYLMNLET